MRPSGMPNGTAGRPPIWCSLSSCSSSASPSAFPSALVSIAVTLALSWLIDVQGWRKWVKPAFMLGMNPLAGELNGSLAFALTNVALWLVVAAVLYHRDIFIKA